MRFFAALLSLLSVAAVVNAAVDYEVDAFDDSDYETAAAAAVPLPRVRSSAIMSDESLSDLDTETYGGPSSRYSQQQQEPSMSTSEMAMMLKALTKFDRFNIKADRIGSYDVNPDINFDNGRSLNLKMTPIVNIQKSSYLSIPTTPSAGSKIMLHLLSLGIKPSTVKQYLSLKRQGFYTGSVHNPVNTMLRLQREQNVMFTEQPQLSSSQAFVTAPTLSSAWGINQPILSSPSPFVGATTVERPIQHGVVIPSLPIANSLRDSGVVISTTVTGHPAIELKHLQESLLQCEKLQWNTEACVKLNEFALNVMKEHPQSLLSSSSGVSGSPIRMPHSSIVGLTSPQIMSNIQLENMQ